MVVAAVVRIVVVFSTMKRGSTRLVAEMYLLIALAAYIIDAISCVSPVGHDANAGKGVTLAKRVIESNSKTLKNHPIREWKWKSRQDGIVQRYFQP